MGRLLLTGATGRLGQALTPRLHAAGRNVVAASRSPPSAHSSDEDWVTLDLATDEGIEAAVADANVVVHAASAPTGDTEAVDVEGTRRLLDAASDAGVSNFVYPSIVGIEDIPYSYYEAKLAAERAVVDSDVPHTVLRATQFHEFVADTFETLSWLPVWPLPTRMRLQPVAVGEVADALVACATPDASGRVPPVAGPELRTVGELARAYRDAMGWRTPVVRLPLPGAVFGAFRAGEATRPDRSVGTVPFAEWLQREDGDPATAAGTTGGPT